jgi:hypothetical protein
MTEAEWLACDDPRPMLDFVRGRASARKLRLFACTCCWLWKHRFNDYELKWVEVAERFADGLATPKELDRAWWEADTSTWGMSDISGQRYWTPLTFAAEVLVRNDAARAAMSVAGLVGWDGYKAEVLEEVTKPAPALLRDLFGPLLFRPAPRVDPAWLAWNGGTVRNLAETIYGDRAFDRLPVLADALEDAGCADPDILAHCRGPGPHVRGCWAIDLLLGKE